MERSRLVIRCPDRPGIIAAVSDLLFRRGINIVHSDQHSTHDDPSVFFLRIEVESDQAIDLDGDFAELTTKFNMTARLVPESALPKLAVFVSKEDHCLQELLWQCRSGDIPAEVAIVVSNHPDLRDLAEHYGATFHHVPMDADKHLTEQRQQALIEACDAVVLARYMQIVSPWLVDQWAGRMINIHHSFLPAFVGANPYRQAYHRGVKLIGATAHYVTSELDAGPIIEQDVQRVDHRAEVTELRRLGRQVERAVLARAVKWHVEDRVLVDGNRTVVFS
jgi:formyltetrahydrofolate deformylase